eukprot:1145361-Pelagomonas_calceolata.AAC.1
MEGVLALCLVACSGKCNVCAYECYDEIRQMYAVGYDYAARLHANGCFDNFDLAEVLLEPERQCWLCGEKQKPYPLFDQVGSGGARAGKQCVLSRKCASSCVQHARYAGAQAETKADEPSEIREFSSCMHPREKSYGGAEKAVPASIKEWRHTSAQTNRRSPPPQGYRPEKGPGRNMQELLVPKQHEKESQVILHSVKGHVLLHMAAIILSTL